MILSLDISLNTGWALGAVGEITFGTRIFAAHSSNIVRTGRRFREWLDPFIDQHKPTVIVLERPFLRGDCTWLLVGLAWEAQRAAEEREIPCFDYAVSTIKKYATGNGFAKKPEMVKAVREWGYNVTNDHEADAIAILMLHATGDREHRKNLDKDTPFQF